MVKIKSIDDIVKKWTTETPARVRYYEAGVKDPTKDWAEATAAAEAAYESGVTAAIGNKLYGKGVKKAGTAKWQNKSIQKGVPRYPEGVRVAGPEFQAGFAPYRDEIEKTVLPPRGARGDPGNIERVRVLAEALAKKRLAVKGAGT